MRRPSTRRFAALGLFASATGIFTAIGCSLNLDSSLMNRDGGGSDAGALEAEAVPSDAQGDTAKPVDGASTDGAMMGGGMGECSTDADCQGDGGTGAEAGGCVASATCDTTWHLCVLDVCPTSACQASVCLPSSTCSLPATYGFSTTSFSVSYGGVIGAGPTYAIAAAWPFVFVATNNGVIAYNVVDPTSGTPPVVPVHGVPFVPLAVVAVGRRVYFVTDTQGAGPSYHQAIAWVDVPQNPFVTSFEASSAWVSTNQFAVQNVLTNGASGLFLAYGSAQLEPVANVQPPLGDLSAITAYANAGLPMGAYFVASTGPRLLSYRYDGTAHFPNFALITKAGTSLAQANPEQTLSAWGPMDGQASFATGGDGSVVYEGAILNELDAGGSNGLATARLSWLIDSATGGNIDTSTYVDLVHYSPPANAQVVGPTAWVDPKTALALVAPSALQTNSTVVQVANRTPPGLAPGKKQLLSVAPSALGVSASNGFAYALAQDDPSNQTCTVYEFAPSCGSGD